MTEAETIEVKAARQRRRRWVSWLKRGLAAAVALAAVAAIVVAWMPKPVPVDLGAVQRQALQVTIDEDGRTRVKDRYLVSAPLLANLARIELRPGDAVKPGDVLARLMPLQPALLDTRTRAQAEARVAASLAQRRQVRSTIDRVRTALEMAEREAKRQRELKVSGATPARAVEQAELELRSRREELASARFGAKVADSELEMARAALGRLDGKGGEQGAGEAMNVTSPVAGRVLRVIQESAGVVQPGTPLLELGDPAALEIVVDVLTSDAVDIEPGTPVRIERWGGERALRAHVRLVEPSAFTRVSALGVEEQRVNVIIDLDEPHEVWEALGDGYRVEARIVTWQGDDVLTAPASAVFRRGDGYAAFRHEDGKAELIEVQVGRRNAHRVQVLGGLSVGDRLIVHPSDRIAEGVSVSPRS
jgi:HlyD family secretion protein